MVAILSVHPVRGASRTHSYGVFSFIYRTLHAVAVD